MVPFDAQKLNRLMREAGMGLLAACSRHNVRYLTGGYYYHFHANATRMGRTQYLPFVGIPQGHIEDAFFVCRGEESGQIEAAVPWIHRRVEAVRGTVPAAEGLVAAIQQYGLADGVIGLELPFLPADALATLQHGLPKAHLLDATPLLDELRAVKTAAELAHLRVVYDRVAQAIQATFAAGRPGITTAEIAHRVQREMALRDTAFLYALVCAGPGWLRAPSSAPWEEGRILHIDAGGEAGDYLADICRMGCLGEPSGLAQDLYHACIEVQDRVRRDVRPGLPCRDLLVTGEQAVAEHRFSQYGRFVAHGIGMVSHEQPDISRANARPLEAGMVLSIETEFLHSDVGHVKIEDAVAVTEVGSEGLGDLGREWHIVRQR